MKESSTYQIPTYRTTDIDITHLYIKRQGFVSKHVHMDITYLFASMLIKNLFTVQVT